MEKNRWHKSRMWGLVLKHIYTSSNHQLKSRETSFFFIFFFLSFSFLIFGLVPLYKASLIRKWYETTPAWVISILMAPLITCRRVTAAQQQSGKEKTGKERSKILKGHLLIMADELASISTEPTWSRDKFSPAKPLLYRQHLLPKVVMFFQKQFCSPVVHSRPTFIWPRTTSRKGKNTLEDAAPSGEGANPEIAEETTVSNKQSEYNAFHFPRKTLLQTSTQMLLQIRFRGVLFVLHQPNPISREDLTSLRVLSAASFSPTEAELYTRQHMAHWARELLKRRNPS